MAFGVRFRPGQAVLTEAHHVLAIHAEAVLGASLDEPALGKDLEAYKPTAARVGSGWEALNPTREAHFGQEKESCVAARRLLPLPDRSYQSRSLLLASTYGLTRPEAVADTFFRVGMQTCLASCILMPSGSALSHTSASLLMCGGNVRV